MLQDIDTILEALRANKQHLENNFFVTEIGVFGSYARGDQTENSDIDILVDFKRGMTLFNLNYA